MCVAMQILSIGSFVLVVEGGTLTPNEFSELLNVYWYKHQSLKQHTMDNVILNIWILHWCFREWAPAEVWLCPDRSGVSAQASTSGRGEAWGWEKRQRTFGCKGGKTQNTFI